MEVLKISRDEMETGMKLAIDKATETMREGVGGPFGAVVLGLHGEVLSIASNSVLGDHDPTAHAEVNAIRQACKMVGSHDLSGCTMIATGFPCAMCLSAMIWANIDTCYYGCTPEDADKIGFRDDFIYDFIQNEMKDETIMEFIELGRKDCLKMFDEYHETNKQMY